MATFNFGQQISGAVGQALDRQMQMADLARVIQNDAFSRRIQGLAQQMDQKRLQMEQDAQDASLVADALDRQQERREFDLLERLREAQIANTLSLANSRDAEDDDINQGVVSMEFQALSNSVRDIEQRINEQREIQRQIFDTNTLPEDMLGANPTDALFSITGNIIELQSELERKKSRLNQLREVANVPAVEEDEPEAPSESQQSESPAPFDDL